MSLIRLNTDYVKTWFDLTKVEQTEAYESLSSIRDLAIGTVCYEGDLRYLREYYNSPKSFGFGGVKSVPGMIKVDESSVGFPAGWVPCWLDLVIHPKSRADQYMDKEEYAIVRCPPVEIDTFPDNFSLLATNEEGVFPQEFEDFILSSAEKIRIKISLPGNENRRYNE